MKQKQTRAEPAPATSIRLYNLFPLLTQDLQDANTHFPRIAAMGFDWVFINPVHRTGGSRSLYAVASYDEIDPRFASGDDLSLDVNIPLLTGPARTAGLSIMVDLVINHTADSHPFTTEKPHWYLRDADGKISAPFAIDPAGGPGQVWGDLAELDFGGTAREQIVAYFCGYVKRLAKLGVAGFRCDAAYKVPGDVWKSLIKAARGVNPKAVFAAETLGCRLDEIEALRGVGFDYFFNSAKWWDLSTPWAVGQYNQFRDMGPSIAFPESHDTARVAADLMNLPVEAQARRAVFEYAKAACFSSGVMMPMGYEYGLTKPLSVTETTPADWQPEAKAYDLSSEIRAVNLMKAAAPALNVEGAMEFRRFADGATAFARYDQARQSVVAFVANIYAGPVWIEREEFCDWLGVASDDLIEITPGHNEAPEAARRELLPFAYLLYETAAGLSDSQASQTPEASPPQPAKAWSPQARVAIEHVYPEVDGGRFPAKRIVGDRLRIEADILSDGHDRMGAEIAWHQGRRKGRARMRPFDNDRWRGDILTTRIGRLYVSIEAWIDAFETWRYDTGRKYDAKQAIHLELGEGRKLLEIAAKNASVVGRAALNAMLKAFDQAASDDDRVALLFSSEVRRYMARFGQRDNLTRSSHEIEVTVDRERAANAAWYEMFHRSQGTDPDRSATFDDCIARLPYVRDLGFDVVYLVPHHPIGLKHRKGRDNSVTAQPGEPGSPYAIGGPMGNGKMGGHLDVHPDLGTLEDFRRFVKATRAHGMEVAIDFAIQCSMDHPWIAEHPEWFYWRADGTIKYAENPPKKYQDIVNVNFFGPHWQELWHALRDVVLFWVDQGVDIFRVDNPHTKPLPFWEWMIREVQAKHPQTIFLAEAFTKPKMMAELAKCGFTQSYTYFTWRNTKGELIGYMNDLTQTELAEYYRPNFFTSTPDILPTFLQSGKQSAFMLRAALAAFLSGVYGIYNGFELCEGEAVPGKEEYLHSEKYQYKAWDWDRPGNIRDYIRRLNEVRRDWPQFQRTLGLRFHGISDDRVLFFSKVRADKPGVVFVAVMLDPDGYCDMNIDLPLAEACVHRPGGFTVYEPMHGWEYVSDHGAVHIGLSPDDPCQVWGVR